MKKFQIIFLFFFLLMINSITAQPPEPDTVSWSGIRTRMISAPILRPGAVPMTLLPNRQRFCFDMTLHVEMVYGGTVQQGVFLNTTDGYIGFEAGKVDGSEPITLIMPELPDFSFMVFGYKGNAYRYFNRKNKQGVQEHWVSTGNTNSHKYQLTDALTVAPIERKNVRKLFCDGKANAMAYKLPDQPTVWYIYGDRYPEKLHIQKFFGGFGVGVVRCEEGVFMIMEMQAGRNRSTIKNIDQAMACFNATDYKIEEDEFIIKRRLELDKERARVERHAASAQRARTCQSQRMAIVNFEREELNRQEENLTNSTHGNTFQDSVTQKAYAGMMDPLTSVYVGILEAELNICEAQEALNRGASESAQQKLACNSSRLARLTVLQQQMRALDTEYASQPGMALGKKAQLLLAEMRISCN
ncbi:hypothetical protein [Ferruginibacter sp.]